MGSKPVSITISRRALLQRINRALIQKGQKVRSSRGGQARAVAGAYYLVSARSKVIATNVDLEKLGRSLGVLQDFERVTH